MRWAFGSKPPAPRYSAFMSLVNSSLESERASIEQKLHTCSRIMRTHNDVSLAGAPRLRGR